jgi:hypothetical protein
LNKSVILNSIEKFLAWKNAYGYYSYDQYDFWSSKYGIWSKALYYKKKAIGALFVVPIFITEIFFPSLRKLVASKKRIPIGDAHFLLGYLNLYKYTSNEDYLEEAKTIGEELLKSSVPGFSGNCWGYPFNWMTTRGLWNSGVPLITTTAYCFEAFLKLYDETNEERYLKIAHSVFLFALNDLKDTRIDENTAACSYSPIDNSQIVNANAYRLYVLVEGARRFKNDEALSKASKNLNFILKNQNDDGSWLYAVNDKRDNFIDHFHTCFVLKNLFKANCILKDERITLVIKKGFDFYKNNLFDKAGFPLPFAKLSRFNIVKKELYDYAESISLCIEMSTLDNDALLIKEKLIKNLIDNYQMEDGHFITRVSIFNMRSKVPYLRWPQAQLFCTLTKCLTDG